MTRIFTLLIILLAVTAASSQEKKDLTVSLHGGIFNSPYYAEANSGRFMKLSFDYNLSKKGILFSSYLNGHHRYFEDKLSNTSGGMRSDGTNAKAVYQVYSIGYKYRISSISFLTIVPGAGAGIMTHSRDFPFAIGNSSSYKTSTWSDIVFPVTIDVNFKLFSNFQLGISGGFLIHPDYPVLGLHAGPGILYTIK